MGYYQEKNCIVCGKRLVQPWTGRKRVFCSNACRQREYREAKQAARGAVDAALAGIGGVVLRNNTDPGGDA